MLAKLTSKNQLTIPRAVAREFRGIQYFDVRKDGSTICLTPVRIRPTDAVRAKLAALGISDGDVKNAVAWARGKRRT